MSNEKMRRQFTKETDNLAIASINETTIETKLHHNVQGPFWETLAEEQLTLAVSREYEHFVVLMSSEDGLPWQSPLPLPHPSGMFYDDVSGELLVSSTRTPNQIFFFKQLPSTDVLNREIIPESIDIPIGTYFLPYKSLLLPGTLYIHDIVLIENEIYATITGHNFLAKLFRDGGWERVWWPSCVDHMGGQAFNQNYLQLNSIARGGAPETSYYTGFSDQTTGAKPWKDGYGPKDKGVVFGGRSRDVILRGLTCPHSAKSAGNQLWICNSGYGDVGVVEGAFGGSEATFSPVVRANGFTRGLALHGRYGYLGLSKVIDFYEPYAPGLKPDDTVCGVMIFDTQTGETVASLTWPQGYQVYDVQVLPKVKRPILPHAKSSDGINHLLRYIS